MPSKITTVDGHYHVKVPYSAGNYARCQGIPHPRWWSPEDKAWIAPVSPFVEKYLRDAFPHATWDGVAAYQDEKEWDVFDLVPEDAVELDYTFKFRTTPFPHQHKVFSHTKDKKNFALFMEQRTGKTKVIIDTASYLFEQGKIDRVLVITLNSIRSTWIEELNTHSSIDASQIECLVYDRSKKKHYESFLTRVKNRQARGRVLSYLISNVEGLAHDRIADDVERYLDDAEGGVMIVIDESTSIASPKAKRSKNVYAFCRRADYRRLLCGTPIQKDLRDLYGQFYALDPNILNFKNLFLFERFFVEKDGYEILFFKHRDTLQKKIYPHMVRVLRKDVFKDIPEEMRFIRAVQFTPEQQRLYNTFHKRNVLAFEQGGKMSVTLAITKMLREHQMTGGFMTTDDGKVEAIPGANQKILEMMSIIHEEPKDAKVIVWARYKAELDAITYALSEEYGMDSVVEIRGGVTAKEQTAARHAFQDVNGKVRFLVGQTDTGGIGINLDAAWTMIYFSNSHKFGSRMQSEARPMSSKQRRQIGIYDIVMENTVDETIIESMAAKKDLAEFIDKNRLKSWLVAK